MGTFQLGSIVPSTKPRGHDDERNRKERPDANVYKKQIWRILHDLLQERVSYLVL